MLISVKVLYSNTYSCNLFDYTNAAQNEFVQYDYIFFVEFSLWKSLFRAIKPPIYWGQLVVYFPA